MSVTSRSTLAPTRLSLTRPHDQRQLAISAAPANAIGDGDADRNGGKVVEEATSMTVSADCSLGGSAAVIDPSRAAGVAVPMVMPPAATSASVPAQVPVQVPVQHQSPRAGEDRNKGGQHHANSALLRP